MRGGSASALETRSRRQVPHPVAPHGSFPEDTLSPLINTAVPKREQGEKTGPPSRDRVSRGGKGHGDSPCRQSQRLAAACLHTPADRLLGPPPLLSGLDKLHNLTTGTPTRYEVRVDLQTANESAYAVYDAFQVASSKERYRLSVGKYRGTAGGSAPLPPPPGWGPWLPVRLPIGLPRATV